MISRVALERSDWKKGSMGPGKESEVMLINSYDMAAVRSGHIHPSKIRNLEGEVSLDFNSWIHTIPDGDARKIGLELYPVLREGEREIWGIGVTLLWNRLICPVTPIFRVDPCSSRIRLGYRSLIHCMRNREPDDLALGA